MRVLVTGGAGFIGTAVRHELELRHHVPVLYDHPNDVLDTLALYPAVADVNAVIHLAGRLGTAETFGVERETASVNIIGALNVADACRHFGVPMVQIGTGHKGQPNPYAITKACAEDLLLGRARQTGQQIVVVRAFHAYGAGQKACAPHGYSPVRKIIPSFVCRALTGMPIEVTGDGSQVIDLVHVREVARVLVDAITAEAGSLIEAGTGVGTTATETAEHVVRMCRSASPIVHVPMRPGEPEGTTVVATAPACGHPFPFGMDEVIDHYRKVVAR